VEFVSALPERARQRNGVQKALLVEALGTLLPAEITAQRKRTFTLPWEQWLRGPLKTRLAESFANLTPPLRAFLKIGGIGSVWQSFLAGRTTWSRPWAIFVLNEWMRRQRAEPAD